MAFNDAESTFRCIRVEWTDFHRPDPFITIGSGKSYFHVHGLIELVQIIDKLKGRDD